jgi:endonuclease/exonuclease/phosphatase (EEP) superfamily protein YafD
LLANWPSRLPVPLRVRKDHVLASASLRIGSCSLGDPVGSDHLPLLVRFDLPP